MGRRAYGRFLSAFLLLLPMNSLAGARAAEPASVRWAQAWPMVGHDPQRTARGGGVGPLHPHLLWTYRGLDGPPLIGPDGSAYSWGRAGFTALTRQGQRRWTAPVRYIEGGPAALGPAGLLHMNAESSTAYTTTPPPNVPHMAIIALSQAGQPAWTIRALPWATVPQSVPFSKGEAPLVTPANRLYMPFVGPVYRPGENDGVEEVSATGTPLRRLLPGWSGAIALARDGSVYEVGSDTQGHTAVLATRAAGALSWSRSATYEQPGAVLVGRDGTVYASDGTGTGPGDAGEVSAYTPAGHLRWRRPTLGGMAALAERGDGTILIATAAGLTAVSPRGARLWQQTLGAAAAAATAAPSLAVDGVGHAYVSSSDGRVRGIAPTGAIMWTQRVGGATPSGNTPSIALGPDGTLLVAGTDGQLRAYQ